MGDLDPRNLIGKTSKCTMITEMGLTSIRVTPEFYKNVATSKAFVLFRGENEDEIEHHNINSNWMFESVSRDHYAVIYGTYEYGARGRHRDFMLRFDQWNHVDVFRTMFNKCIKFESTSRKGHAEQRLEELNPQTARYEIVDGNVDEASMLEVLNGENPTPKQNLYIRPSRGAIKTFTCNRTVGITNTQFAAYFDVDVINAPKKHWRGCPGLTNAQPLESHIQGDPILEIERYTFHTPGENRAHRQFQPGRGFARGGPGRGGLGRGAHHNPLANL